MIISNKNKVRLMEIAGIKAKNFIKESFLDELSSDEVSIPKEYVHDTLNPAIWDGDILKPDVRDALLKIAKEYYEFLKIRAKIEDIKFVGSMANYNWSNQSDLDVHLLFDISAINKDENLVKEYLDTKEKLWKDKHHITVKGFDVELYAQDLKETFHSGGIFNLTKNEWEKKPIKENVEIDKEVLANKISKIATAIENLKSSADNPEIVVSKATKLKDKIKKMRQSGLDKEGEFSIENLAFKYLRNHGFLGSLFDMLGNNFDKELSLDEVNVEPIHLKEEEMKAEPITNKHKLTVKASVDNLTPEKIKLVKRFIVDCCKELNIQEPCKVYLTGERGGPITTTASYNPNNDDIWIYTKNRNMLGDILRSLAHEIRHFKQKLDNELDENSGETGSKQENEANSFSGVMIRKFGKKCPAIFQ